MDWKVLGTHDLPLFSVVSVHIILIHHVHFLVDKGIDKTTAAFILAGSLTILS